MLVINRFSERKKVFKEGKRTGKIHAKRSVFFAGTSAVFIARKIHGEVRVDGLVASIFRWRLMSRIFGKCCSSFRSLVIKFRVGFCGDEGGDKELVMIEEVGGVLLGGRDGSEGGRL
ncbi:hypothetical protein Tco_1175853 [Tanacetum coccineum]